VYAQERKKRNQQRPFTCSDKAGLECFMGSEVQTESETSEERKSYESEKEGGVRKCVLAGPPG